MDAKEMLREIEMIDLKIKNKLIERHQWLDVALGITASMDANKVSSSTSTSRMADAVGKCIDMEAEIDELVDALVDAKRSVIAAIEQLDSAVEYNVLHLKYIQYMDLQEIAEKYHKDYSWATTTHGRAIRNLQKLLDSKNL